jgi:SH3 domain protein
MRTHWQAVTALILGVLVHSEIPAQASAAYVDDRLQVGLHESASLASTIVELLPSGASLEILERDGDMARVQVTGGATGWVDARFLTEQPPGRARVQELERELAGAQAALADAEAKMVAAAQSANAPPPAGESEAEGQAIPSDALREMQALAEENQRLKQQMAELEAVQRMSVEQAPAIQAVVTAAPQSAPDASPAADLLSRGRWQTWHLILGASILLLAFSAGGWLVDWGVRRRHGGFRL